MTSPSQPQDAAGADILQFNRDPAYRKLPPDPIPGGFGQPSRIGGVSGPAGGVGPGHEVRDRKCDAIRACAARL